MSKIKIFGVLGVKKMIITAVIKQCINVHFA